MTEAGINLVLPEWLQMLAGFVILVVAGLAAKFGWHGGKEKQESGSKSVEAVKEIVANALDRFAVLHDERVRMDRQVLSALDSLVDSVEQLSKMLKGT